MKFLIAGLGSIGRRHLRNLAALGERDVVLYRTHHSTLPEEELAGYPQETSLEAALAHRPDAVIVCNPTALHLAVALPAAQAGCALLLEKPISHSLDGLDELQQALDQSGRGALVGFQFRYHPGLKLVRRLTEEGALGRVLSLRGHWGEYLANWHPWEDYRQSYSARKDLGGGVVFTLTHPLDYLRWLFGEAQVAWAATAHLGDLQMDVEDTAEIGLRFDAGILGSLHLDYNQRPASHWLEVTGTQGSLRWDNADGSVRLYRATASPEWETFAAPEGFERNQLFLDELRHFIAVARGQTGPVCTLQDGRRALEMALRVHEIAGRG
jgi:predicted dehydrogenase